MTLAEGDLVVPAGVFNGNDAVADLSVGSLCPEGVNIGSYSQAAAIQAIFPNGQVGESSQNPVNLRKVTTYTGTDLLGKDVKLTGAGAAFIGTVIHQFDVELDATNGDGTPTPVVVVKTGQFTYIALPASVEEV